MFQLEGVYDFLAAQAAVASETAQEAARNSSFTVTGTAQGQVAIWSGAEFQSGALLGDSNGISVALVTSPVFGLRVSLSQNLTTAASPTFAGLTLTAPLSVGNGGTGANNAAGARGNLGAAAKAAITGATIPLAKITGGGTDGSITVNADGIVTGYVAPT